MSLLPDCFYIELYSPLQAMIESPLVTSDCPCACMVHTVHKQD